MAENYSYATLAIIVSFERWYRPTSCLAQNISLTDEQLANTQIYQRALIDLECSSHHVFQASEEGQPVTGDIWMKLLNWQT